MSDDDSTGASQSDRSESQANQHFDPAEDAVDTVQEALEDMTVPDSYEADRENLEDRLESFEDALDDAQDGEHDARGRLPAFADYIQQTASNLTAQLNGAAADQMQVVEEAFEDVEDHIDDFDFDRTRWYVQVDDTPVLAETDSPKAETIIADARSDVEPDDYVLKAKASRFSDDVAGEFSGEQGLPVAEYFYYELERSTGGGRA